MIVKLSWNAKKMGSLWIIITALRSHLVPKLGETECLQSWQNSTVSFSCSNITYISDHSVSLCFRIVLILSYCKSNGRNHYKESPQYVSKTGLDVLKSWANMQNPSSCQDQVEIPKSKPILLLMSCYKSFLRFAYDHQVLKVHIVLETGLWHIKCIKCWKLNLF